MHVLHFWGQRIALRIRGAKTAAIALHGQQGEREMGTRLRTARAAFFLLLILAAAASDQLLGVAAAFLI